MFSTFTGNSKRPRNVNLSGQASNPFSNTSWSPSAVSNATKAVSNAQADREKRSAERKRLGAASKIQKTWRGYRSRSLLKENRRAEFDNIYQSPADSEISQRLPITFNLLLSFFTARRSDDLQRLFMFINDCNHIPIQQLGNGNQRLQNFVTLLVRALEALVSKDDSSSELPCILALLNQLISYVPHTISESIDEYYNVMGKLCRVKEGDAWRDILTPAISAPLKNPGDEASKVYTAFAFSFLTCNDLVLFEGNLHLLAQVVDTEKLASVIQQGYLSSPKPSLMKSDLLWLFAHFIGLNRAQAGSPRKLNYLHATFTQLSALSADISIRIGIQPISESRNGSSPLAIAQPLPSFVLEQLLSLVDSQGIASLLRDFSVSLVQSSTQEIQGNGLLAGYILALLQSFPSKADDTRMRLFLENIPTKSGQIPIVKYLWQIMHKTSVFQKLNTESERPVVVLRRYFDGVSGQYTTQTEQREWRIILLFLELYTFILRLSDDDDFFSGIYPDLLNNSPSISRTRSCSLSLQEIGALTTFLKNSAFALHYNVQEISRRKGAMDSIMQPSLESYWDPMQIPKESTSTQNSREDATQGASDQLDLDSLRGIITTALKMLYERDSRKHFLPADHWLMTSKLENEDFISAVIAEEERQLQEQNEDSDEEMDNAEDSSAGDDYGFHSTFAGQRLSHHVRLERLKAKQVRAQRERRLAEMGPKLEVLKHIPFVVPFEARVMIFRQFIQLDRLRRSGNHPFPPGPLSARHLARIRRHHLFEDAFEEFYQLGEGLKDPIQITFVDQFGAPEAGIDGGGVTKEFLTSVTTEAFGGDGVDWGMFASNEKNLLYPNPIAVDALRQTLRQQGLTESDQGWRDAMSNLLKRFEFLGRIIGKCLYEGILVDLAFAGFFLLKWPSPGPKEENNYKGSVNDLQDMDESLYMGLLRLKNYTDDVSALGFDFTITDQTSLPSEPITTVTRKLIPNGDEVQVTNDNRLLYISYTARHRLVVQPALQTAAFLRGLRDIIRPSWLSMFNQSELQRLVGGDSTEIDIEDLRCNTVYSGVYEIGDDNQEHPTIKMFWNVMAGFTDAQRRDVLKYVSSTPRAPLLGFSQLRPKFSIRDGGSDESRLPSTSTCVNLLKLPIYRKEAVLREKLLYAVTSGAGFDLS